jgi:hypothetical protein
LLGRLLHPLLLIAVTNQYARSSGCYRPVILHLFPWLLSFYRINVWRRRLLYGHECRTLALVAFSFPSHLSLGSLTVAFYAYLTDGLPTGWRIVFCYYRSCFDDRSHSFYNSRLVSYSVVRCLCPLFSGFLTSEMGTNVCWWMCSVKHKLRSSVVSPRIIFIHHNQYYHFSLAPSSGPVRYHLGTTPNKRAQSSDG